MTIDGDSISTSCRRCKTTAEETGDHLVFDCTAITRPKGVFKGEAGRRTWRTWEDIDIGNWTEVWDKGGGKEETSSVSLQNWQSKVNERLEGMCIDINIASYCTLQLSASALFNPRAYASIELKKKKKKKFTRDRRDNAVMQVLVKKSCSRSNVPLYSCNLLYQNLTA